MRSIIKSGQPQELIRWKANNAGTPQNLIYGGGSFPSEEVRQALLTEQYHLCAYTLRRLKTASECQLAGLDTRASCHIEHLLPQSRGVPGEDIDFHNMLACYPPSQSTSACEYGAKYKDDFDPQTGKYIDRIRITADKSVNEGLAQNGQFVSPLTNGVESHFKFDERGGITGITSAGETTVKVLKLDHKALVHDRAAVIKGYLQPNGKKLTAQAARRLANNVLQPDAQNCLPAFCVAVAQTALDYAKREERRAARMKKRGER